MGKEKESMQDFILRMKKNNRLVYIDLDGVTSVDLDAWLDSQPALGLLYDLNRLPEQANMEDDVRGVNDFAVGVVITRLYERCVEKDKRIAELENGTNDKMKAEFGWVGKVRPRRRWKYTLEYLGYAWKAILGWHLTIIGKEHETYSPTIKEKRWATKK